jgi:Flp pilus assembly pilin Flp
MEESTVFLDTVFSQQGPALFLAAERNTMKKNTLKKRRGQGMTEYIIIVALIAIAAIGIITLFGDNIRRLFGMSADALSGLSNVSNRAIESKSAGSLEKKTMKSFGQNNTY